MRRKKLVLLAVAFVIAVGLNWPVAWFWTMEQPGPGQSASMSNRAARRAWNAYMPDGDADSIVVRERCVRFIGHSHARIQGGDVQPTSLRDARVRNLRLEWSGFPFRSVTCAHRWDPRTGTNELVGGFAINPRPHNSWLTDESYYTVDSLPYAPLWLGLIANALIYTLLMISPFYVPKAIVRYLRSIQPLTGKCPECQYDMCKTPDRCPECGWRRTRLSSLD